MEEVLLLRSAGLEKRLLLAQEQLTDSGDSLRALVEAVRLLEGRWEGLAQQQWKQHWLEHLLQMQECVREAVALLELLGLAANRLMETERIIAQLVDRL